MKPLRHFSIAWQFLTVVPLTVRRDLSPDGLPGGLSRSMAYYPAVGFLLGGGLWVCWALLSRVLPLPLVDFLLISLLVVLTGGLHLDGLADTLDGLGGGRSREEALKIMRDVQIGAFGIIGLILLLMGKYLSLTELPHGLKGPVLLAFPAFGRWAMVLVGYFSGCARPGPGLAQSVISGLTWRELSWATLSLLLVAGAALGPQVFLYAGLVGIVSGLFIWYFRKKLGGVTGDCLGAVGELSELIFLLAILWVSGVTVQ